MTPPAEDGEPPIMLPDAPIVKYDDSEPPTKLPDDPIVKCTDGDEDCSPPSDYDDYGNGGLENNDGAYAMVAGSIVAQIGVIVAVIAF